MMCVEWHQFLVSLTDEEIDVFRQVQRQYPGETFTNVIIGLAREAAEKRIQDERDLEKMYAAWEREHDRSEKDCMWS